MAELTDAQRRILAYLDGATTSGGYVTDHVLPRARFHLGGRNGPNCNGQTLRKLADAGYLDWREGQPIGSGIGITAAGRAAVRAR